MIARDELHMILGAALQLEKEGGGDRQIFANFGPIVVGQKKWLALQHVMLQTQMSA